ncbi:uncharacterized protein [Alexandromys fortis]|uniref:uncharacterized protein n=1 Tax=Alexandromys fortis TaxID=100897 RepID=UPI002152ECEC|nr:uncharacterized protein LOC126489489 [Microtus fortis]
MTDYLKIQELTYTMYDVMQGLYDFPPIPFYLILGISFVLHIFFLKTWFDNRAKNEALLEMVQFLQTDSDLLKGKLKTLEKDEKNLADKTKSNEVLLEKVQSLQTDSNLLKGKLKTLEKDVNNLAGKTQSSEVLLETVQSLQTDNDRLKGKFSILEKNTANLTNKTQAMTEGAKTLSGRMCAIECISETLVKGYDRLTDRMSLQEENMLAIKIMSKSETSFLLDRLSTLESSVRALEQKTRQEIQTLQKAVVKRFEKIEEFIKFDDQGQKVQRQRYYWREEAKILEQEGKAKEFKISQDQILGEGHTINVETFDCDIDDWVRDAISKGIRRYHDTKCFNCGRIGHLRRDCRQGIPRNNVSSGNGKNRRTQPLDICRRCGKGRHWTNECRSTRDSSGNPIPLRNSMVGLL